MSPQVVHLPVKSYHPRAPSVVLPQKVVYILHLSFLLDLFLSSSNTFPLSFLIPVAFPSNIIAHIAVTSLATMKPVLYTLLATAAVALAGLATVTEPALSDIKEAQATTRPEVTTSDVKGLVFDRFFQVWLENIVSDGFGYIRTCSSLIPHSRTTRTRLRIKIKSSSLSRVFCCKSNTPILSLDYLTEL